MRLKQQSGDVARPRGGFTLIEVMAAMAVLSIIMIILTRIFGEASEGFRRGSSNIAVNSALQGAMELVVRDVEGMVADAKVHAYYETGSLSGNLGPYDRFALVTQNADFGGSERALETVVYYVEPAVTYDDSGTTRTKPQLMRAANPIPWRSATPSTILNPYSSVSAWWNPATAYENSTVAPPAVVMDNILMFQVRPHDQGDALMSANTELSVQPAYVDILIKAVPPEIMRQAHIMNMSSAAAKNLLESHSRAILLRVAPLEAGGRLMEQQNLITP